jgi:hypothetical protein
MFYTIGLYVTPRKMFITDLTSFDDLLAFARERCIRELLTLSHPWAVYHTADGRLVRASVARGPPASSAHPRARRHNVEHGSLTNGLVTSDDRRGEGVDPRVQR